ncbi:MAG TPA: helix-turn-helix transcriptional regulator [Gemmatimonadota bacterium]|nr:helix-turn-helix transcriptional regulator [Gemmatimonadota bacterium]
MPSTWQDRIQWIATTFEEGNLRALGRRIGVTGQAVSAWTRGEARPAGEALSALARTYPKLDCRWLLTGRGEPLVDGVMRNGRHLDGAGPDGKM